MEHLHSTETIFRSNWFTKFVECLFAAVAVTNSLAIIFELLPKAILAKLGEGFFEWSMVVEIAVAVLFALIYSIYWHKKEIAKTIKSGVRHAWFRGVLRYWLAFDIATYGFAKILKTQFAQSFHRDDTLVGSLNGFNLTWNYFAHSYTMAVIIALCQIGGAILLLFRKTTLLAVTILLPIMVNILLINVFYNIAAGAFLNSVLFTLGLSYLLMLRWHDLKNIFIHSVSNLPKVGYGWFRWAAKFFCIAAAFGLIYSFVAKNQKCTMQGKWKVDALIRNHDTIKENAWLSDSTAWKTVYIEDRGGLLLCPNPYLYDDNRSQWADYEYDSTKHNLQLIFWDATKPTDTVQVAVNNYTGKKMQWKTVLHKDTLQFNLTKVK